MNPSVSQGMPRSPGHKRLVQKSSSLQYNAEKKQAYYIKLIDSEPENDQHDLKIQLV